MARHRTDLQAGANEIDWRLDTLARHAHRLNLPDPVQAIDAARVEARKHMHPEDVEATQ